MKSGAVYTPGQFPFAALFEQLTDYVQSHTVSPLELYNFYCTERRRAKLTPCPDYASTSITSGGHARRPGLDMTQIITANTRTARDMVAMMEQQGTLDREAVIVPVDLGHVPGWKQSDYIHFWLLIIGGFALHGHQRLAKVTRYESALTHALSDRGVNLNVMNSFDLSAADRAPHYFKFAEACVQAAQAMTTYQQCTPVRKIVSLIDPHVSLGGQTERYFARLMNIPVYLPRAVQPAQKLSQAITSSHLARDVDTIIRFGGTVCEVAAEPALICIRDDSREQPDNALLGGGQHRILG